MSRHSQKNIEVWANWDPMNRPVHMGNLFSTVTRGSEIFSFEYNRHWLKSPFCQIIDPALSLFTGPQYAPVDHSNFGVFLDSCPDRWGRLLMRRREAQIAREEKRPGRTLETNCLFYLCFQYRRPPQEPWLFIDSWRMVSGTSL